MTAEPLTGPSAVDPFESALSAAAAIRSGAITPRELLDECLSRVDEHNPAINAVIWRNDDEAREQARHAGDALVHSNPDDLPPFHGVPMPIKDLVPVAGWPTTYGSDGASDRPATTSAPVVQALRRAGFVLTGRTNTSEFGALPVSENTRYGITRNPWNTERTAGGSSGGSAAAVAAGMFPIAHGNDGGGSMRVPAACTGLVALKPARGRVPSRVRPWEGTSVEGVLTRDVRDAAAVLDVISGPDRSAWYNAPPPQRPFAHEVDRALPSLRIGVQLQAPFGLPVDEQCRAAARHAADALSDAGHDVTDVTVELLTSDAITAFVQVSAAGLGTVPDIDWRKVEPHVRAAYARGHRTDSLQYAAVLQRLEAYTRRLVAQWGTSFDILLTPTTAILPPPAGEIMAMSHARPHEAPMALVQLTAFTTAANLTGLPAVSVPARSSPDGPPVGVMLTGGPWGEATLVRLAAQLEKLLR